VIQECPFPTPSKDYTFALRVSLVPELKIIVVTLKAPVGRLHESSKNITELASTNHLSQGIKE